MTQGTLDALYTQLTDRIVELKMRYDDETGFAGGRISGLEEARIMVVDRLAALEPAK